MSILDELQKKFYIKGQTYNRSETLQLINNVASGSVGQFKVNDPAPVTPQPNQSLELIGTGVGSSPSGTYTNLFTINGTTLVIPAPAPAHAIINARAVWNGSYWIPVWQDITLPAIAQIQTWTAQSYYAADQVNYQGLDWIANVATAPTDVPGASSKWQRRIDTKTSSEISTQINDAVAGKANQSDLVNTNQVVAQKADQSALATTDLMVAGKASQTALMSTNAQVAQKANQSDLSNTNANVAQLALDLLTQIGLVVKYGDLAKLAVRTNQMFDKATFIADTVVTFNTGSLTANTGSKTSRIKLDTNFAGISFSGFPSAMNNRAYRFEDKDQALIAGAFGAFAGGNQTLAIPAGAVYVAFTWFRSGEAATIADALMVNRGNSFLPFEGYNTNSAVQRIYNNKLAADYLANGAEIETPGGTDRSVINRDVLSTVLNSALANYTKLTTAQATFVNKISDLILSASGTGQLFNKNVYTADTLINTANGLPQANAGSRMATISLDSTKTNLVISGLTIVAGVGKGYRFEDAAGALLGTNFGTFGTATTSLPIPAGAKKFTFTYKRSADADNVGDTVMINYGTEALPYADFAATAILDRLLGYKLRASYLSDDIKVPTYQLEESNKQLFDKNTVTTGDPTLNGIWQERYVAPTGVVVNDSTSAGWVMGNILISDSTQTQMILDGLQLASGRYWRIIDAAGNVLSSSGSVQYDIPSKIFALPAGAKALQINLRRSTSASNILDTVVANYGNVIVPPVKKVVSIDGYGIKGADANGGGTTPVVIQFKAFGDSTTYGADLADPVTTRWSKLLADQLGLSVTNYGSSGARAEEITARLGGETPLITITNGVITPNAYVAVTYADINPVRSGEITNYAVILMLPNGTQIKGDLNRSSGFMATSISASVNVGTSVLKVYSDAGKGLWGGVLLLGQGINNEPNIVDGSQTIAQVKDWYIKARSAWKGETFVWGVLDRGTSEAAGTTIGDYIIQLEAFLQDRFGNRYIPVRKYLASQQALADALIFNSSFVPTSNDNAAVAAKTVPPSFRVNAGSVT